MRISDWSSDVCSSDLLPEEGVTLHARSRDMVGFIVAGPKSRELLARLTDEDVSNAGFPFMDFRRMDLGMRSEEHTSELQSLMRISYAVFCLKKKKESLE